MKYIYFICALTYFYVSAEDQLVLQGAPTCQCTDILNDIIDVLNDGTNEINSIGEVIAQIKNDLEEVETGINTNSDIIEEIETKVTSLTKLVNTNLNVVNYQTFIINDIEAKVTALEQEEDALDCVVDDSICRLTNIQEIVAELETCSCTPKTTTPRGNGEITPTPYSYQH